MAKEILIADADKADQKEFKKIFEATDYNLVFSDSGEQVLLRLKLFKPDLIIIGASLKEKRSLEVFKAIKADPESKNIPVILFSNILKGISEEDRKRFRADGIITPPFQEDETLNLVDRLLEEEKIKEKREGIIGREMELKSVADKGQMKFEKKEDFLLDEVGEAETEEIIDLVDMVEEPERKMSIQDFVTSGKEAPFTEITPLETWEKLIDEEKPADRRSKFGPDEKEREAKGLSFKLGEEVHLRKEVPEKELSEKIELEEILQKVEQMTPSIEEEWPPEERRIVSEERRRAPEKVVPTIEKPTEEYTGLAEFEAALKKGLWEKPLEEEVRPSYVEKPKEEPKAEIKEEIKVETKEKPKMEAPKEFAPAEVSLEEEIKEVLKKLPEEVLEEELKEVKEEELPELLLEEPEAKRALVIEEPKEKELEIFEEIEFPEVEKEEIRVIGEPEEERIEIFEEIEVPEVVKEEVRVLEKPPEERLELVEEVTAPKVVAPEIAAPEITTPEITVPFVQREAIISPLRTVEQQMEDVISKGAREIMEGFITKLVPEMTQSIINLTIERIERMVREIVPEIAEKMIQEEIKRLQKGEKD